MTLLFKGVTKRRDPILAGLRTGESIEEVTLPEQPFTCGVMLNNPRRSEPWLGALIRSLIERGAFYLAFWGTAARRRTILLISCESPLHRLRVLTWS
jgi:hypothetical protein